MPALVPLTFDRFYHIYLRGAGGAVFLRGDEEYARFLALYEALLPPTAATYAYCLLPNHCHFLIRVRTLAEQAAQRGVAPETLVPLSATAQFAALGERWAETVAAEAPVVPPTFAAMPIDDPRELPLLVTYLHHNAQTHGVSADYRQWRWSSYAALHSYSPTRLERAAVLGWFFGRTWYDDAHWRPVDEARICHLIRDEWDEPRPDP